MLYDERLPDAQRQRFSSYYYRYVALGEGCGCAEQVLARRSGGFLVGVIAALRRRFGARAQRR